MIQLEKYSTDKTKLWDQFVEKDARNATFLHSRKFFLHNPLNEADDCSLMFYKNHKLVAVLPANIYVNSKQEYIFHSHQRSTYGGFVINRYVGVEDALKIVEKTIDFARDNMIKELIIRNPFRIFNQLPADETDYAMWYYGFTLRSREIESAILLNQQTKGMYADGTKRSIKKAFKNVSVKFSYDYATYWEMLTKNLLAKHTVQPVHNIQQFMVLYNLVGQDCIKLVTAQIEGKIIGGIVLFVTPIGLHAQYIASDSDFQELRPVNAVIDFIIDWGIENKFSYFNLGSGNEDGGRKINAGLFSFKEGFGGRGVLRETMSLILNH